MSACTPPVRCGCAGGGKGAPVGDEVPPTLPAGSTRTLSSEEGEGMAVRGPTPRGRGRPQGLPDDRTGTPYRGKPAGGCPDGPRRKATGDGTAVPAMRWVGEGTATAGAGGIPWACAAMGRRHPMGMCGHGPPGGRNLPPGCPERDIDAHFGGGRRHRGECGHRIESDGPDCRVCGAHPADAIANPQGARRRSPRHIPAAVGDAATDGCGRRADFDG